MGSLLSSLLEKFWSSQERQIIFCGLENAGKTTLVNILSGYNAESLPTIGVNVRSIKKGKTQFKIFDMGGADRYISEWGNYTANCDMVLFVVDSHDVQKIPKAKKELHKLLEDPKLNNKPILVVLNKIDLEPRLGKQDIVTHLNLDYLNRPWMVLPISAKYKVNIEGCVEWLLQN